MNETFLTAKYQNTLKYLLYFFLFSTITMTIFIRPESFQWDFRVYYNAALSFRMGLNPYDFTELFAQGLGKESSGFTYLPLIILPFIPLSFLPLKIATFVWFSLKLLLFGIVYKSIHRYFFTLDKRNIFTAIFFLFAFNSALIWDFSAGNVAIPQMCLLWLAFTAYIEKKHFLFASLITVCALIKFTPIFFLFLLLLHKSGKRLTEFCYGVLLFAILIGLNKLIWPEYFQIFLHEASVRIGETGILAASTFSFFTSFIEIVNSMSTLGIQIEKGLAKYLYLGITTFILAYSYYCFKQTEKEKSNEVLLILFFTAVYTLILPRGKSYSYVFLIPAAIYMLRMSKKEWVPLLFCFFCLPHVFPAALTADITSSALLGPFKKMLRLGFEYLPLLQAFAIWLFFVNKLKQNTAVEPLTNTQQSFNFYR